MDRFTSTVCVIDENNHLKRAVGRSFTRETPKKSKKEEPVFSFDNEKFTRELNQTFAQIAEKDEKRHREGAEFLTSCIKGIDESIKVLQEKSAILQKERRFWVKTQPVIKKIAMALGLTMGIALGVLAISILHGHTTTGLETIGACLIYALAGITAATAFNAVAGFFTSNIIENKQSKIDYIDSSLTKLNQEKKGKRQIVEELKRLASSDRKTAMFYSKGSD